MVGNIWKALAVPVATAWEFGRVSSSVWEMVLFFCLEEEEVDLGTPRFKAMGEERKGSRDQREGGREEREERREAGKEEEREGRREGRREGGRRGRRGGGIGRVHKYSQNTHTHTPLCTVPHTPHSTYQYSTYTIPNAMLNVVQFSMQPAFVKILSRLGFVLNKHNRSIKTHHTQQLHNCTTTHTQTLTRCEHTHTSTQVTALTRHKNGRPQVIRARLAPRPSGGKRRHRKMVMVSVWMWVVVGVCHAQGHGRVPREVMGGGGLEGEGVRGEGVGGNEGMVVRPQGEDLACFHHIGAVLCACVCCVLCCVCVCDF